MSASLSEVLLRIATAIAADGGASVRAALEGVLREAVPFDAGELAFVRTHGDPWRQPLGTGEGRVLGVDLLGHVTAQGAAYRIDDWRDAESFAQTLGLLRARALRSLLVVPFRFDGPGGPPVAGALAVGRSHGWAFVGASLPLLMPLAAMAGLALDRALVLTTLGERARALGDVSPGGRSAPDTESVATALGEERAKSRDLLARAEAAEGRLQETERSCDELAQKAASLRKRTDEQGAEILSLRRGMTGACETAASAADVAVAAQGRIRELQDRASELEGTIRALERGASEREDEAHELDEATGTIASLEQELRRAREAKDTLEGECSRLAARLDETVPETPATSRGSRGGRSARRERS